MEAKIAKDGAGLAPAGHQILTQIAYGPKRAEKVNANNRLPGADIQRHKVVLIGILYRQCHPHDCPKGTLHNQPITCGCGAQALFHADLRFFNAALMPTSQRIHGRAASCDLTKQINGSSSTSGRFRGGPLTQEI
ncbi:MAG: hypothetical protein ACK45D_15120 [Alphaproteobacteria bacterium]